MDATVEVVVATAVATTIAPVVTTLSVVYAKVVGLISQTTTSTVRSLLRIGRSSLSAVPGDYNFTNGGAVLAHA